MTDRPTILFAGGGTGGHLYSGVAVAAELDRLADVDIAFVGTEKGLEARVIPDSPWRLLTLEISGIKGRGPLGAITGGLRAAKAILASRRLLRRERPVAVVGIGGYASGPTVLAAALAGYPTAIIEQNVIPGFTNKVLSRFVRRIYLPAEAARKHFPKRAARRSVVSGNPIRTELLNSAASFEPPAESKLRVLIFGGSQGARRINEAVIEALGQLADMDVEIVHQTGELDHERVKKAYADAGVFAEVRPYIDDMGSAYAAADLVVCRAGASTLAELTALGKPALLVPYPHAIYNHQELNARALAETGAATWIADSELTGNVLVTRIREMAGDRQALSRMGEAARRAGHPEAARRIAMEVLTMADLISKTDVKAPAPLPPGEEEPANERNESKASAIVNHKQTPTVVKTPAGTVVTLISVAWATT